MLQPKTNFIKQLLKKLKKTYNLNEPKDIGDSLPWRESTVAFSSHMDDMEESKYNVSHNYNYISV